MWFLDKSSENEIAVADVASPVAVVGAIMFFGMAICYCAVKIAAEFQSFGPLIGQ